MGWRDILRSPDPSRALYMALRANPTASRAADVFQGGFEGAMEGLSNLGQAATIPARAVAGFATNQAGTQAPVDVSDYALYGRDLETGRQGVQYGDLLAGTLEDSGEIQPGGLGSKAIRLAGNTITDPGMAPAMLSGADAIGALAGKLGPSAASAPRPTMTQPMPRSRPSGQVPYVDDIPTAPPGAPVGRPMPPSGPPQQPMFGKPMPPAPEGGPGMFGKPLPGKPRTPRPRAPKGPAPAARGGRAHTETQPVQLSPEATQRVKMTRGPGGKSHLRPKAQRKPRTPKLKEKKESAS